MYGRRFYVGEDPAVSLTQQMPNMGMVRAPSAGILGNLMGNPVLAQNPGQFLHTNMQQPAQMAPYAQQVDPRMMDPRMWYQWNMQGYVPQQASLPIVHGTVQAFDPNSVAVSMPTRQALQTVGFTPATLIAAGASTTMIATIEKPMTPSKLTFGGDIASFVVLSMTAAGNTIIAGGGEIPCAEWQKFDELENIGIGFLNTSTRVSMVVQNISGAAANLRASLRGLALQG